MKKFAAMFLVALSVSASAFEYDTITETLVVSSVAYDYTNFSWDIWGYNDQKIVATFDTAYTNIYLRFTYPRNGTVYLTVTNHALTNGTEWTAIISRTNLPPSGSYFCEFLGWQNAYTSSPTRILAAGRALVHYSIWEGTTQSTWTNPLRGTVIGPPVHTLSTPLEDWGFIVATNANWWRKLPTNALNITTNSYTAGYVLSTANGTNLQWIAGGGAANVYTSSNNTYSAGTTQDIRSGSIIVADADATNEPPTWSQLISATGTVATALRADIGTATGTLATARIVPLETATGALNTAVAIFSTNTFLLNADNVATGTNQFAGPALSSVGHLTSAPTSNELVTAEWVRGLFSVGVPWYGTTNVAAVGILPTNTTVSGSIDVPAFAQVEFAVTGVNHYAWSMITTNTITGTIQGPAQVEVYLFSKKGTQRSLSIKPELYWVTNLAEQIPTNGDWEANAQALTMGVTNRMLFTIAFPDTIVANAYLLARIKITAKGNLTTNAIGCVGLGTPSHIQFRDSATSLAGAALKADDLTQFTGLGGTTGQVFVSHGTGVGTWQAQSGAGGGSQTPVTNNVDFAGYVATNVLSLGMSTNAALVQPGLNRIRLEAYNGRLYILKNVGGVVTTNYMEL